MAFSTEWEQCYKANTQMIIWPWSDLVSYVMRYARPTNSDFRVLELGCGAGANIPFFRHLGVQYYAIEGSETIAKALRQKFTEYKNTIITGDFTQEIPFNIGFDLIVDRSSVTHNNTESIKRTIKLVYNKMISSSKFIGIDWFSTEHSDYLEGKQVDDVYTHANYRNGQFVGVGKVHFSNMNHLKELFGDFVLEICTHKKVAQTIPPTEQMFASYNFVARKP